MLASLLTSLTKILKSNYRHTTSFPEDQTGEVLPNQANPGPQIPGLATPGLEEQT